ncbi:hypothetical protein M3N64_13650 [Sporolactobacillus sp. CPB3-1]|uniref:Uncharacterized protein n=1 Tax=Sporolactobacillus mangiferae TaxID=2940498 RepID=A0ABT0MF68_9BACL|nr:hypothetical protein [Sporolactobacillus mangiferae]MCL1632965.1 hypothetical protein [Sporolactobacillus mangiferae]
MIKIIKAVLVTISFFLLVFTVNPITSKAEEKNTAEQSINQPVINTDGTLPKEFFDTQANSYITPFKVNDDGTIHYLVDTE